jgi:nucleotide-binding universal stress UspA family protein
MKKILCPTDFSDVAENAIGYAAKIAQAIGAELVLLNIQSLFERSPKEIVFGDSHTMEKAAFKLEILSREIASAFKISCYSDVEPSIDPLSSIISENARNADLIVMGTNGANDLYQYFMGSNSYNVALKTSAPILLIPEECSYNQINRILYAFDYLHERTLPLLQLIPWIEKLKCDLSVLQVMEESYSEDAELDLESLQLLFEARYSDRISLVFERVRSSEIAFSIHSHVLKTNADILALCTRHHSLVERLFHKSVIKKISAIASYPVLIFHK